MRVCLVLWFLFTCPLPDPALQVSAELHLQLQQAHATIAELKNVLHETQDQLQAQALAVRHVAVNTEAAVQLVIAAGHVAKAWLVYCITQALHTDAQLLLC
jgi:hypothetical protein